MAAVGDNTVGERANEMGDFLSVVAQGGGRSVKAIAAGAYHTCFLLDTDQVRCAGRNDVGQLGVGDADGHFAQWSPAGVVDFGPDP